MLVFRFYFYNVEKKIFGAIMIIGDTMGNKVNLLDMSFKNMSVEEKRAALVVMDVMLKKLHEKDLMVTDFNPNSIYFQDGIYSFEKVAPISMIADNKEEAILNNVIWMSVVALWAYNSNPVQSLMAPLFVSNNFNSFSYWYPEEDKTYYQSILVDSYRSGKLIAPVTYLSDHIIQQHKNRSAGNNTSLAYIKATEAGRALANKDEAAFGHNFFFVTMVASLIIIMTGLVLYFVSYLG